MSRKSRHKTSSASTASSSSGTLNLIDFSFLSHKATLTEHLTLPGKRVPLVEDSVDFWKFISKYESMLRSLGQPILPPVLQIDKSLELQPYHKRKYICMRLDVDNDRRISTTLAPNVLQQFREIILIYLDFKQKEKFEKIKKLRQAQKALPIARFKQEIQEILTSARVLIVAGDTGCGKSTQLPQYLYEFGYRSIACTQPRRLACVSLSKRVAHEMLLDYDTRVGFQIRFEKTKTTRTNIVFITEGLLLRQLVAVENLEQYDVLILDEIHERNLFGDFLLGITKCLLLANPKLKLILMSATINVALFHDYFKGQGAKLVQVPGRLFPIKTVFMPPPALELNAGNRGRARPRNSNRLDPAPYVQVLSLIDQKYPTTERGDVLIFVSGANEITSVCDAIKEYAEQQNHWIILPLHSGLALPVQDKVFDYAPDGMRKCIVSTNIAETSLTVDGIRFVIDSGKVKEMSYDATSKSQRLKEFWISKSSAEQRAGRAGRTGPGNCFRLYAQKQYDSFEDYPAPEILRVPLDAILLQMMSMGLPDVRAFPFIEAPPAEAIEQTILALKQHHSITASEEVTPLGKALATLPVELTIGKMLLKGSVFGDVEKTLTLAAILSVQNPFTTRAFNDPRCKQAREPFMSDQGDVFTLMCAYHKWLSLKCARENTRKWCYKLGIEEQRFYEITKLRNQFQNILENCDKAPTSGTTTRTTSSRGAGAPLTSAERTRRHGEIRTLKAIKRQQKHQAPRRRKLLKQRHGGADEDDDVDDVNPHEDIRDVELRLSHDSHKFSLLLHSAQATKMCDVVLLKLIFVSGFYPQMAIADEFNYCKGGNQQFFHTKLKPFLTIHPNAYFATYFDLLKLNESDIQTKPDYYTPKQVLSTRHQLLCYQSLLETAKPYLMNCIRLPAAQTLLLFAYTLDTNASVTRIVCDDWLCLEFPIPESGLKLLLRANKLRQQWNTQLNAKLEVLTNTVESQLASTSKSSRNRQDSTEPNASELWDALLDYMNLSVACTIKRLLPADLKTLYTHAALPTLESLTENPFDEGYAINQNVEKGGCNVSAHVVYGCLQELPWTLAMDASLLAHNWSCENCQLEIPFQVFDKLVHLQGCKKRPPKLSQPTTTPRTEPTQHSAGRSNNPYYCEVCKQELRLTQINMLRHKYHCGKGDRH